MKAAASAFSLPSRLWMKQTSEGWMLIAMDYDLDGRAQSDAAVQRLLRT